jgi:hypothetical protein
MDKNELFEMEDLPEIFQYFEIEAELLEEDNNEQIVRFYSCRKDDLSFRCYLFGTDDFPQVRLAAAIPDDGSDLLERANSANSDCMIARVYVETGDPEWGEPGSEPSQFLIAHYSIYVAGGVSTLHVGLHIMIWLKEVTKLLGIEDLDDEDTEDVPAIDSQVMDLGTVEQVQWILAADSVPRTAKQLASFLMKERQEINRTLYANPDRFVNDGTQPPKWTIRSV